MVTLFVLYFLTTYNFPFFNCGKMQFYVFNTSSPRTPSYLGIILSSNFNTVLYLTNELKGF